MYGEAFSRIYSEYGWNIYAELFAGRLLRWIRTHGVRVRTAVDLGCGTGVLCRALAGAAEQREATNRASRAESMASGLRRDHIA